MKSPMISVDGLTRRYRGQLALDDDVFDVQGASITGLLAALVAVLLAGGFTTVRRVTV